MHSVALAITLLVGSTTWAFDGNYSANDFMGMPDFPEAIAEFDKVDRNATIEALLAVIAEHGLGSDVSVSFNHRHFGIAAHEQIVEVMLDNETVTKPYYVNSTIAQAAVPYMWSYTRGRFAPVEFVYGSADAPLLVAKLAARPEFYTDYSQALEDQNATHFFGMSIKHRKSIRDPRGTMETNSVKKRTLRIRTVTKAEADAETEPDEEDEEDTYKGPPRQVHWSLRADYAPAPDNDSVPEDPIAHYMRAVSENEHRLGEAHPHTLASYYNLAVVLEGAGQIANAHVVLEKAVPLYSATFGADHEETTGTANFLHELQAMLQ